MFDDYQKWAKGTRVYDNAELAFFIYCTLKLVGEAGEFAEKVGKAYRDNEGKISPEMKEALMLELGDVMWYIANAADELGYNLSEVIHANKVKITGRIHRGTLKGTGDHR